MMVGEPHDRCGVAAVTGRVPRGGLSGSGGGSAPPCGVAGRLFGVGQGGVESVTAQGGRGSALVGGGTQDRRVDDGEQDLAAGGRKKGARDPAPKAAEIAVEGPFPLVRVCEVLGAPRSTIYHRRSRGDEFGIRSGPTCGGAPTPPWLGPDKTGGCGYSPTLTTGPPKAWSCRQTQ